MKGIKVVFEGEETEAFLSPGIFSFHDFDNWARSRFGVSVDTKLKYVNKSDGKGNNFENSNSRTKFDYKTNQIFYNHSKSIYM